MTDFPLVVGNTRHIKTTYKFNMLFKMYIRNKTFYHFKL